MHKVTQTPVMHASQSLEIVIHIHACILLTCYTAVGACFAYVQVASEPAITYSTMHANGFADNAGVQHASNNAATNKAAAKSALPAGCLRI